MPPHHSPNRCDDQDIGQHGHLSRSLAQQRPLAFLKFDLTDLMRGTLLDQFIRGVTVFGGQIFHSLQVLEKKNEVSKENKMSRSVSLNLDA